MYTTTWEVLESNEQGKGKLAKQSRFESGVLFFETLESTPFCAFVQSVYLEELPSPPRELPSLRDIVTLSRIKIYLLSIISIWD